MRTLIPLLASAGLCAATVHVSNAGGDDRRDGASPDQAVATFARATALLRPGDTLSIAATGTAYRETLTLDRPLGTPAAPLVVEGHGAVISGLRRLDPARWQEAGDGVWTWPVAKMASNCRPWLALDGAKLPVGRPEALAPGEHAWTAEAIRFRPADGRRPADLPLDATLGDSGVRILAGFITVREVVAQEHANDGFNIHGVARGVVLERVEGRSNGDDGCSIHEDGEITVRDSRFHGNSYGIEDVNASTSGYIGVVVEGNHVGVHMAGGWHRLVSCRVTGNATAQIQVTPSQAAAHLGSGDAGLPMDGSLTLADTVVQGGTLGLEVGRRSRVSVVHGWITGSETAIAVRAGGAADVRQSVVAGTRTTVLADGAWHGERNGYAGAGFRWATGGTGAMAAFAAAPGVTDRDGQAVTLPAGPEPRLAVQPFASRGRTFILGPVQPLVLAEGRR